MKNYNKLFDEFKSYNDDNEKQHIIQDKIYKKFVKDIAQNKLSSSDIKLLAKTINSKIVKYDKNRWYS